MSDFRQAYAFIQEATDRLNEKLNKEDEAVIWKSKEDYDSIVEHLTMRIKTEIDEMIEARVERRIRFLLETYFKELGFNKAVAWAKASDIINESRKTWDKLENEED